MAEWRYLVMPPSPLPIYQEPDPIYRISGMPFPPFKTNNEWIGAVREYIQFPCPMDHADSPMDHADSPCTIFMVPEHIRQLSPKAYEPLVAFLGPFYHFYPDDFYNFWVPPDEHLPNFTFHPNHSGPKKIVPSKKEYQSSVMRQYKRHCVRRLLSRHGGQEHANKLLKKCLLELKERDAMVRSCYSEQFSALNAQDLALMMLLDGCFIIYLMLKMQAKKKQMHARKKRNKEEIKEEERELLNEETKEKGIEEETEDEEKESLNKESKRKGMEEETKKEQEEEEKESLNEENKKKGMEEEIEEEEEEEKESLKEIEREEIEDEEIRKFEDETTREDEGKKRREYTIETREGDVVLNIEEEEKLPEKEKESLNKERKRKGMEEEIEEEEEEIEVSESLNEEKEGEEREEQFQGPTVAGLFTIDLVVHDLLKLENQIPFFIIELLFNNLKTRKDGKIHLVKLALQLFEHIYPEASKKFTEKPPSQYHHLLHLFYSSRIPAEKPQEPTFSLGCIHLATECIKTKRKKRSADSFLNITFEQRKMKITSLLCLPKLCSMFRSGRMEIPSLQIYDYTGPLFQNLIASEQCYYDTGMYFTIYALFMDCIINQAEDVRLLNLEGILVHELGNEQAVADLFNKLGRHIHCIPKKNYLAYLIEKVSKFYNSRWHKWLAGLRRDYLGNPWAIISVLGAIFLLLLTFEQSLFSTLSYFHSS